MVTCVYERVINGRAYHVDSEGYLLSSAEWDENFVEGMASGAGISSGLTENHWRVIRFVHNNFAIINACPLIYVACKRDDLGLGNLDQLFPEGYFRSICKLAGITYRDTQLQYYWIEENIIHHVKAYLHRTYLTDRCGYLLNPLEWDECFALLKACEVKPPQYLTEAQYRILYFLRTRYLEDGATPTVWETCRANDITLEHFNRLFLAGFAGAVKIAGLRENSNDSNEDTAWAAGGASVARPVSRSMYE